MTKAHEPRFAAWLKQRYAPMLDSVILRWQLVAAVSFALLTGAGVALTLAGRSFLPEFREGTLTIAAVTLPGTSLAESDAMGRRIEQTLLRHPEVVTVARRTGRAEMDEHAQGVNAAELDVTLRETERSREAFLDAFRRDFSMLSGTNITIGQPIGHRIDHMLSGTRASIAVKVFGDELAELRRLGTEVEAAMRTVPGVVDLAREQQSDIPFARVRFDRAAIARHGMRIAEVARALEIGSGVHVVSQVMEGQAVFDLVVRTEPSRVQTFEDLQELLVTTPSGATLPLRVLAQVHRDRGPNEIGRENVQRKLVVSCNVAGRDVGSVVRDIQAAVDRSVHLPAGYRVAYGGEFDEAVRRAARERLIPILMTALAAGLGLVPLALSGGEPGSEIQTPMAVVILCGLLTSTALNMFVVPALYRQFGALAPGITARRRLA